MVVIVEFTQRDALRTRRSGGPGTLVPALDVGVEPVQLLLVLADHRAHDVADGDHPHHLRAADHRDVPDTLVCAPCHG